jgi:parallel beta-helix repeat protein
MESKKLVSLLVVCLLLTSFGFVGTQAFALGSNEIRLTFEFPTPVVTEGPSFDSVMMSGLTQDGAPGEPVLPFRLVKVLIPQGKGVQSIDVSTGDRKALAGKFYVDYGKVVMPTSSDDDDTLMSSSDYIVIDQPDESIYNSADPFPGVLFSDVLEQYLRGYKILELKLNPVHYIPATGELFYFDTMTVTITLEETGEISPMLRDLPEDTELVMSMVDNPSEIETYSQTLDPPQSGLVDPSDSYDYVIITTDALKSSFQPLVDWKISKGITTTIVTVEDVMNEPAYNWNGAFGDGYYIPEFNDTQAHIRNFIKDAYMNWETEYILLGGDAGPTVVVPHRKVYVWAAQWWVRTDVPCDTYYGGLDGSWNADCDSYFAEGVWNFAGPQNGTAGEEADFFLEVYVGRAPVNDPTQVARFIYKTLAYEQDVQTNPDADYLKNALLIGESLDTITQGGNTVDGVSDVMQQYSITRLYARDGTYSSTAVRTQLNSNQYSIVNHAGHSSASSVMGVSRSQATALTNTKYFIAHSTGCTSTAFEQDSVAERFITSPTGGAFAYIGNAREGWYYCASPDGPSDLYMREFWVQVNSGVRNVGKALALAKNQVIKPFRLIHYVLTLLGDPETEIFTAVKAPTAHFKTRTNLLASPRIGGVVELLGTAKRGTADGATFSYYLIDFGSGTNPTTWSTTGITLANGGSSEVVNGILATWDTTLVSQGTYTLRLRSFDTEGRVGQDRWIVVVRLAAQPIYIRPDGSIDPSTELIERDGDVYTLTGNIAAVEGDVIVIQRDNIILDGAGYTVQGIGKYGEGIDLVGRSNVTIKNITVTGCHIGIYLKQSSHNTISGSIIIGNTHGILLEISSNNKIVGNNITTNSYGIALLYISCNNIVVGNWITNHQGREGTWAAVFIDAQWSINNSFDHNVFMNNYRHAYVDEGFDFPFNIWDDGYPRGGNYWSGYTGVDLYSGPNQDIPGSDGIGDTPYVIDTRPANKNIDRYPLMTPPYSLTVNSLYDTPGGTGWYNNGTTAYATLSDGVVSGGAGIQYVFTGWSGDASGTGLTSNPIIMNGPKIAIANWKTQYYLTVKTDPTGLVTISGEGWYDEGTDVTLTAPNGPINGPGGYQYFFLKWQVDSADGAGNPITVHMGSAHTATACYVTPQTLDFSWTGPAATTKGSTKRYSASYKITANTDLTNVKLQGGIGAKAKNIKIYLDGKIVAELSSLSFNKWTKYMDGTPFPAGIELQLDVSKQNNVFVLSIASMKEGETHTLTIEFDWTFSLKGTESITGNWSSVCTSCFGTLKTPYTDTIKVVVE